MQYMLLIYDDDRILDAMSAEKVGDVLRDYAQLTQDLKASGVLVGVGVLQRQHTATTVRVREGKQTTTDGPFAETREVLGGYYLVEVANLEAAVQIAARIPSAAFGSVEVRPVQIIPEMSGVNKPA